MGISLTKTLVAFDPASGFIEFIRGIDENVVRDYLKTNSMPKDSAYSPEDLRWDLCHPGVLFFPPEMKQETIQYIEQILNDLDKKEDDIKWMKE